MRPKFLPIVLFGICAAIPAFVCSYNYVLNQFYASGCPLEDQGITAYLMWRNSLSVQFPPAIAEVFGDPSSFAIHLVPIFSLTSMLTKMINVSMAGFYAFFHGISHGLLALSLYFIFYKLYKPTSTSAVIFFAFISLLFSLNGIAVSSMLYPHYEMLFVPLAIFFLGFLVDRKPLLAFPFFILALSIKECTGFHLFAVLFFLIVIDVLKKRKIYTYYIVYAGLAITYSVSALIIQKLLGKGHIFMLEWYFRSPISFSWEGFKERASYLIHNRPDFYLPIALIAFWSLISKRLYLIFGIIAFIPWFLFNFLGTSTWASGLHFYYGAFYLLIFVWPFLASKAFYLESMTPTIKKNILIGQSLVIAASAIVLSPGVSQKHIIERLQTSLSYNLDQLGQVVVEESIASLTPGSFKKSQLLYLRNREPGSIKNFHFRPNPNIKDERKIDSILYYNTTFPEGLIPFYILASKLPYMYQIVGTNIYLATNKNSEQLPSFAPVLTPVNYSLESVFPHYVTPIFKQAHYEKYVERRDNSFVIKDNPSPGVAIYSMPIRIPQGKYCVTFEVEATKTFDPSKPILTVDIISQEATQLFMKQDFFDKDLGQNHNKDVQACFIINDNLPLAFMAIRFWHHQNGEIIIKNPELKKLN
jgi:hypothetical protein